MFLRKRRRASQRRHGISATPSCGWRRLLFDGGRGRCLTAPGHRTTACTNTTTTTVFHTTLFLLFSSLCFTGAFRCAGCKLMAATHPVTGGTTLTFPPDLIVVANIAADGRSATTTASVFRCRWPTMTESMDKPRYCARRRRCIGTVAIPTVHTGAAVVVPIAVVFFPFAFRQGGRCRSRIGP